jgi:hypothetical protein
MQATGNEIIHFTAFNKQVPQYIFAPLKYGYAAGAYCAAYGIKYRQQACDSLLAIKRGEQGDPCCLSFNEVVLP